MNNFADIEDYILFRGDLSFDERPFQLLDSLVLNELSYVDFSDIAPYEFEKGITLQKAGSRILADGSYRLKNLYGGQQSFFEAAVSSRRFGSLNMRGYKDIFSSKDQAQFAAITFDLDSKTGYIAYRGTDDSIIGWKEDFMISFTRITSQKIACTYLQDILKKDNKKYYVGGHSKGGNLAVYACSQLNKDQVSRIIRIYDHDGPGFAEDVFDTSKVKALDPLVTCVIPSFCIVGKIYDLNFTDTHIVLSKNKGLKCHDLISWRLHGLHLQEGKQNDEKSDRLIRVLMEWAHSASVEERSIFVNEVFDAFQAGGGQTVQDITGKGFLKVLKAMADTSPIAKRIGEMLVRYAVGLE